MNAVTGIGRAIVERCIQEGANVFLCSRKQANVDATLKEVRNAYGTTRVGGCPCNVGVPEALEQYLEKSYAFFASCQKQTVEDVRIDGIVSNAAVNPYFGMSYDAPDTVYKKIMSINVESQWRLVKLAKPRLTEGSSVVFISSIGGFQPSPPLGLYSVSKTAVLGLTRMMSRELGSEKIRVNCVAPGLIKTKFSEALWKESDGSERTASSDTSIPRLGEPVDIAGPVAFLLSQDSEFVTGETLVVSGGVRTRL